MSTAMIDNSKPGDVGVIVIEDGLDVAGIGGLMSTAAKARGMAGVIVDGGVRDLKEVRALGLAIYGRSVIPSSTVSRFAGVARDVEVQCAGVSIKPGDWIVADEDGVVRVPQERAKEVLKRAQEIDDRESKMVPFIQKFKALSKAVQVFDRI
jgi:regulator of RNase E activity RraA